MSLYFSSFTTGFQNLVKKYLPKMLPKSNILNIYDGAVIYNYNGDLEKIKKIFFLNNTFKVFKIFNDKKITFEGMVNQCIRIKNPNIINKKTFRVKFSKENQFVSANMKMLIETEKFVQRYSNMKVDKLNPCTEFWYIIRSEGFGLFGQLLYKRVATEKKLKQGELRPEFAYMMCLFSNLKYNEVVCDPFVGHGAIPKQIVANFDFKRLIISDINVDMIQSVKSLKQLNNNKKVLINIDDALMPNHIQDQSIDVFITDPPWGYYEKIDNIELFYQKMFNTLKRKLTSNGRIIILSAKKDELLNAVKNENLIIKERIDTLVNGKKAALFYIINGYQNEKE